MILDNSKRGFSTSGEQILKIGKDVFVWVGEMVGVCKMGVTIVEDM